MFVICFYRLRKENNYDEMRMRDIIVSILRRKRERERQRDTTMRIVNIDIDLTRHTFEYNYDRK